MERVKGIEWYVKRVFSPPPDQLLREYTGGSNPYGGEEQISRGFLGDHVFKSVIPTLKKRIADSGEQQKVLVVGVGRGSGPFDLMYRFADKVSVHSTTLHKDLLHTPDTLKARVNSRRDLYPLTLSDAQAQRYCKRIEENTHKISLNQLDSLGLKEFDVVVISQAVMGYVGDPIDGVNRAKNLLKRGGEGLTEIMYVSFNDEGTRFNMKGLPSPRIINYLRGVGHGFRLIQDDTLYFKNIDDFELPLEKVGELDCPIRGKTYKTYKIKD